MGLSKRHLDTIAKPVQFSSEELGRTMKECCGDVVFALLMGSARDGVVRPHSDLDIALFLEKNADRWKSLEAVSAICDSIVPGVRPDIGFLNGAESVYRFEALKGNLLFCRDFERWAWFFSLTCREYESQMASYARQRQYRLEALEMRNQKNVRNE